MPIERAHTIKMRGLFPATIFAGAGASDAPAEMPDVVTARAKRERKKSSGSKVLSSWIEEKQKKEKRSTYQASKIKAKTKQFAPFFSRLRPNGAALAHATRSNSRVETNMIR